jgi:hypothetical protein
LEVVSDEVHESTALSKELESSAAYVGIGRKKYDQDSNDVIWLCPKQTVPEALPQHSLAYSFFRAVGMVLFSCLGGQVFLRHHFHFSRSPHFSMGAVVAASRCCSKSSSLASGRFAFF